MTPVFADTSALIAVGNKDDAFHDKAVRVQKDLFKSKWPIVTTHGVFMELFNTFSRAQQKPIAIRLFNLISRSKQWECIPTDGLIISGIGLFEKRADKDWSLVDCISMLVAQERGITEIFTTDHHFEQAGFTILLK